MALKYASGLKGLLTRTEFVSESSIFRLHYQFSSLLLLGSSVFLTAHELYGETISCITDLPVHVINTYCWIKSTFTIDDYEFREHGRNMAQPGVFSPAGYDHQSIEERWTFHNYYQWVVFFLFFQAGVFYLPKVLWEMTEGGLMSAIASGLNITLYKDEDVGKRKAAVITYITTHIKMHNSYVFKYWLLEAACFVNVVTQMYVVDSFLGNQFLTYGPKVVEYSNMDQRERVDPMIYIFPRMTKCTFHKYGPSGSIERSDSLCLLPQNILNEKIFIMEWFWFVILAVAIGVLLLYRLALLLSPSLRLRVLQQHNRAVPFHVLETFTEQTNIGDWWIMYVLSRNIDPLIYGDIMIKLAKDLGAGPKCNGNAASAPALYSTSQV